MYYMRKYKADKLALLLGKVFNTTFCIYRMPVLHCQCIWNRIIWLIMRTVSQ